jgi:putative oxidoreductase
MKNLFKWLFNPPLSGPNSILYIRLMVGSIFLWEGLLKFVYTNQGVGRFTKLGMPYPDKLATFIAIIEIVGGIALMFGLFSRATALMFVGEMIVAILITKIDIYFGTSPLPLPVVPPKVGIWALLHEIRTDYALLICSVFIVLEGPGKISVDRSIASSHPEKFTI